MSSSEEVSLADGWIHLRERLRYAAFRQGGRRRLKRVLDQLQYDAEESLGPRPIREDVGVVPAPDLVAALEKFCQTRLLDGEISALLRKLGDKLGGPRLRADKLWRLLGIDPPLSHVDPLKQSAPQLPYPWRLCAEIGKDVIDSAFEIALRREGSPELLQHRRNMVSLRPVAAWTPSFGGTPRTHRAVAALQILRRARFEGTESKMPRRRRRAMQRALLDRQDTTVPWGDRWARVASYIPTAGSAGDHRPEEWRRALGHPEQVVGVALSPDGSGCVVVCADGTACLLDMRSVSGGFGSVGSPGGSRGRGGRSPMGGLGSGVGSRRFGSFGEESEAEEGSDSEPRVVAYMRLFPRGSAWRVMACCDRMEPPSRDGGGAATSEHATIDALGGANPLLASARKVAKVARRDTNGDGGGGGKATGGKTNGKTSGKGKAESKTAGDSGSDSEDDDDEEPIEHPGSVPQPPLLWPVDPRQRGLLFAVTAVVCGRGVGLPQGTGIVPDAVAAKVASADDAGTASSSAKTSPRGKGKGKGKAGSAKGSPRPGSSRSSPREAEGSTEAGASEQDRMWLETRVFHLSSDLLNGVAVGPKATESSVGGSEWLAFAGSVGRRAERTGTPVGAPGAGRGGAFRSGQFSVSLRGGSSEPEPDGAYLPGAEGPEEASSDSCLGLAVPEGGWDRPHVEVGPEVAGAQVAPLALGGYLQPRESPVTAQGAASSAGSGSGKGSAGGKSSAAAGDASDAPAPPLLLDAPTDGSMIGSYAHWHVRLACRAFSPLREIRSPQEAAVLLSRPPALKLSRCGGWLALSEPATRRAAGDAALTAWHLPMEAVRPRASPPRRDREAENKAIMRAMMRLDEAALGGGQGEGESKEEGNDDDSSSSSSDGEDGGGLGGGGSSLMPDLEDDPVAAARSRIESQYKRAPAGLWVPATPLVPSVVVTNRGCGRPALEGAREQGTYVGDAVGAEAAEAASGAGADGRAPGIEVETPGALAGASPAVVALDAASEVFFDFACNAYCPSGIPGAYCDSIGGEAGNEEGGGGGLIGAGGTAYAGSVAGGRSVGGGSARSGRGSGGASVFGGGASVSGGSSRGGGAASVAGSRAGSVGGASVGSTGSAFYRRQKFVTALPPLPPSPTPVGEPRTFALTCAWLPSGALVARAASGDSAADPGEEEVRVACRSSEKVRSWGLPHAAAAAVASGRAVGASAEAVGNWLREEAESLSIRLKSSLRELEAFAAGKTSAGGEAELAEGDQYADATSADVDRDSISLVAPPLAVRSGEPAAVPPAYQQRGMGRSGPAEAWGLRNGPGASSVAEWSMRSGAATCGTSTVPGSLDSIGTGANRVGSALLVRAAAWASAAPGVLPGELSQMPGAAAWGWGAPEFVLGLGSATGVMEVVAVRGEAGGRVAMCPPSGPSLEQGSAGRAAPLDRVALRGGAGGQLWASAVSTDGRLLTWAPRYGLSACLRSGEEPSVLPADGGNWGMEGRQGAGAARGSDPQGCRSDVPRSVAAPRWARRDGLVDARVPDAAAGAAGPTSAMALLGTMPPPGTTEITDPAAPLVLAIAGEHTDSRSVRGASATAGGLSAVACDGGSGELLGCDQRVRGGGGGGPVPSLAVSQAEDVLVVRLRPGDGISRSGAPALRLYTLLSLCEQAEAATQAKRREASRAATQRRRLSSTGDLPVGGGSGGGLGGSLDLLGEGGGGGLAVPTGRGGPVGTPQAGGLARSVVRRQAGDGAVGAAMGGGLGDKAREQLAAALGGAPEQTFETSGEAALATSDAVLRLSTCGTFGAPGTSGLAVTAAMDLGRRMWRGALAAKQSQDLDALEAMLGGDAEA